VYKQQPKKREKYVKSKRYNMGDKIWNIFICKYKCVYIMYNIW
jgi:hypothetical protein